MSYHLKVKNNTGGYQAYTFFSATPLVSGGTSGPIWSNVLRSSPSVPPGGTASLKVSTNYQAICGSFEGEPCEGGRISIRKSLPIKLGTTSGGDITRGSSVALSVTNRQDCDIDRPTNPGAGNVGSFAFDTAIKSQDEKFTIADSNSYNLLIGIGTSEDDFMSTALGTFVPYPNTEYQITPQAVFYVAAGERFEVGDLVKVERMRTVKAVDFRARQQNAVTLTHNDDMTFTFQ